MRHFDTCFSVPKFRRTTGQRIKGAGSMDYNSRIDAALSSLHEEGRYRVFQNIRRINQQFPRAIWTKPDGTTKEIAVWCGNDYLGMGQHPVVLKAMKDAVDAAGAGSGGTRNISGTTVYHEELEREIADLHGKERALVLLPLISPTRQLCRCCQNYSRA